MATGTSQRAAPRTRLGPIADMPGRDSARLSSGSSDVVVLGSGVIGLAVAIAVARDGLHVTLVGDERAGGASLAAAGILAPGVEGAAGPAHAFAVAARDRYPSYIADLAERTGSSIWLHGGGVVQVAFTNGDATGLRAALPSGSLWMDADDVHAAEPALSMAAGAAFHPHDGAVDNVGLHGAMSAVTRTWPLIRRISARVTALDVRSRLRQVHSTAGVFTSDQIVLAAGAWVDGIPGSPRPLPVRPVRGQMISYPGAVVNHVVYGTGGYAVPRCGSHTLIGATMEEVGFNTDTTPEGAAQLRRFAEYLIPSVATGPIPTTWAGLRPVTPDLLPIIDRDPEYTSLIYACGHSRNGILLAPLTGDVVADLVTGREPSVDIRPFAVTRFAGLRPPRPAVRG